MESFLSGSTADCPAKPTSGPRNAPRSRSGELSGVRVVQPAKLTTAACNICRARKVSLTRAVNCASSVTLISNRGWCRSNATNSLEDVATVKHCNFNAPVTRRVHQSVMLGRNLPPRNQITSRWTAHSKGSAHSIHASSVAHQRRGVRETDQAVFAASRRKCNAFTRMTLSLPGCIELHPCPPTSKTKLHLLLVHPSQSRAMTFLVRLVIIWRWSRKILRLGVCRSHAVMGLFL